MTFESFESYRTDVLARLVKVCIQKHQTSARALQIMRWAQTQTTIIWDSYEAEEDIQDAAVALFRMSEKEALCATNS